MQSSTQSYAYIDCDNINTGINQIMMSDKVSSADLVRKGREISARSLLSDKVDTLYVVISKNNERNY